MDKNWLLIGMATGMAALSGCVSTAVGPPPPSSPPPQSAPQSNSVAKAASLGDASADASNSSTSADSNEVVVYGSKPQQRPTTTVPCGLASLAWSLTHPADAWRLVVPLTSSDDIEACARSMRGEVPVPLRLRD